MDRPTNEYLRFTESDSPSGKTRTVEIVSARSGNLLGRIAWYGPWRQYAFYPEAQTIWNTGCMDTVQSYIAVLMEDRRA